MSQATPKATRTSIPMDRIKMVMEAARWKSAFTERTDAQMAMATQFCFEADPVIAWVDRLAGRRREAAGAYRRGRPGQAANPDQIRHRLRCRPVAARAAKARHGCDQAASCPMNPPNSSQALAAHKAANPGFRDRSRSTSSPLGGIKTNATVGHRKWRGLGHARKRLTHKKKVSDHDPYRTWNLKQKPSSSGLTNRSAVIGERINPTGPQEIGG